ncbi:hypothetical protein QN277_027834 [Acacia crassicarpa]|uniref:Uncharacterized protein n=1 Tax=Acacia crassicarpa TaxID=499986 RepID=A0AAE1MCJ6_9FABA|nr:hypothetical protein QN277_027834 [Acacia crassicarpa]
MNHDQPETHLRISSDFKRKALQVPKDILIHSCWHGDHPTPFLWHLYKLT